ncbi:MAG: serine protease [Vicinamibacterales bacterium]
MLRRLPVLVFVAALSSALLAQVQAQGVLNIRVTLTDAAGVVTPVPRHALLISDNPASASPRRVLTGPDGRVEVRLRPANYTIESEEAVAFGGAGYEWVRSLDVKAGAEVTLELNAGNADIAPLSARAAAAAAAAPAESSPALLLPQWQDSIVAVWTPTSRASGFLVDTSGLVLTNQRSVGSATLVEVQLSPQVKVAARVVSADATRDVAVLQINANVVSALKPVPMACADAGTVLLAERRKVIALGAPMRGPKDLSIGEVLPGAPGVVLADVRLGPGSLGGPVFGAAGTLVGLSSGVENQDERRRRDARIVPVRVACDALDAARQAIASAEPPSAALLPVEPARLFPAAALDAAPVGSGNVEPYRLSASDFDVAFITPMVLRNAQRLAASGRTTSQSLQMQGNPVDLTDFGEWTDYFADLPAVLVVRVTPRFEEGWWTKLARGAALTQGVALPPIKRFKPGFAGLRLFCGDTMVTPIHPFTLQQRVSDTDAVREGLYVFDPRALGPHCSAATLHLSSEKTPDKEDTTTIDRRLLQRIWDDFAPHRALPADAPAA